MKRELLQHLHEQTLIRFNKIQPTGNHADFFNWLDEDEFEQDGKMYDVVKQSRCGDTLIYYCLSDIKETEIKLVIHRWMKEKFGRSGQQKEDNKSNWTKWLEWKYCFYKTKFHFLLPFSWLSLRSVQESLSSVFLLLLAPPPEIC